MILVCLPPHVVCDTFERVGSVASGHTQLTMVRKTAQAKKLYEILNCGHRIRENVRNSCTEIVGLAVNTTS